MCDVSPKIATSFLDDESSEETVNEESAVDSAFKSSRRNFEIYKQKKDKRNKNSNDDR